MKYASSREDIALGGEFFSFLVGNDFRGNIPWSSTAVKKVVVRVNISGKSEVNNYGLKSRFTS